MAIVSHEIDIYSKNESSCKLNLDNQRFGKLLVIKSTNKRDKRNQALSECLCDCGNIILVCNSALKSGNTRSCGCLRNYSLRLPEGESCFNTLYKRYIHLSKRREQEFSLSKDEFRKITSSNCYYCGIEPKQKYLHTKGSFGAYTNNGIDRINCDFGYIQDNVLPCCYYCNSMKRRMSLNEFLLHIKRIIEYDGEDIKININFNEPYIKYSNELFSAYKKSALIKNRKFSIPKEIFKKIILNNCYYCGKEPSNSFTRKRTNFILKYNGIDRVNSNDGYIYGNIVPCCFICNQMKSDRNLSDFVSKIESIYNNLNLKIYDKFKTSNKQFEFWERKLFDT